MRFLNEVLQNAKAHMKDGIPALGVPPLDPLDIGKFAFKEDTSYANFKAYCHDVAIHGFSGINIGKVSFNQAKLEVSATAVMKVLEVTGKYKLSGMALFVIPLEGNGDFKVTADVVTVNITMKVGNNFDINLLKTKIEVENIGFDFKSIHAKLTGLEGGGNLNETLNGLINSIGGRVFKEVEPVLSGAFEHQLQALINDELKKLPAEIPAANVMADKPPIMAKAFCRPQFDLISEKANTGNMDSIFDKILANVNFELSHGYDPWKVDKDAETSFSKSISSGIPFMPDIHIHGSARFHDIEIFGFSHLVRTGPVTLSVSPPSLAFQIGVAGSVHGGGDWSASLTPIHISGSGSVSISNLSIGGKIKISNKKGKIESIGFSSNPDIHVDISGLGPLSWIASQFTDAAAEVISPWLNDIMMPQVKDVLQNQLDKIELPF